MSDGKQIDRRWLVRSRSRVQHRMLRLYEFSKSFDIGETEDRRGLWAIQSALHGIVFSLWRAVFLIRIDRHLSYEIEDAHRLLETLIDTNAIGFPQDAASAQWTSAYYLENTSLRFHALSEDPATRIHFSGETRAMLKKFQPSLDARIMSMETEWEIWDRSLAAFDAVLKDFKFTVHQALA